MSRIADPVQIYKTQSRMLEWLRSLGHTVDFSRDLAAPKITSEMFPQKNPTGAPCEYCEQPMGSPIDPSRMGATRDHVVPISKGGQVVVWACRNCNQLKGNMLPAAWQRWMDANPRWWERSDIGFGARIKLTAEGTAKWLRDQGMIAETRRAFAAWKAGKNSV